MTTDGELLRRYSDTRSEDAFAELVRRHVNLVYSAALRQVNGDAHLAQDVAQTVFTDLARKAVSLSNRAVLTGWFYTSTHFAAAKAVRAEQRRRAREQEAHTMRELLSQSSAEPDWLHLRPALDSVMHELKEVDREAILLRYFENRPLAEIGGKLGLSEDAARKRVDRALDKLRDLLKQRGITTAATLSSVISANAVQIAPAGLAATLTSASITGVVGTGTSLAILKIMSMTKLQFGVTALVIASAATTVLLQQQGSNSLRQQNRALLEQVAQLQTDNESLSSRVARSNRALRLSLPAPRVQAQRQPAEPDSQTTNLIARLQHGEKAPQLTSAQAEKFLDENHRNASSLLAAFRATGDPKLLQEATQKYPNDPQVAFTAAYASDVSPQDRRHWLDVFKQAAPENSLANYLSALDHFKAGRTDQAIQDLSAADGKSKYQDYSWDFVQGGEEAYRSAGYSEAEARIIPSMALVLPQLGELKQLNEQMVNLASAYRQAGDEASAQAALQMDAALGQRLDGPGNTALITQLVGMAIETIALKQMDPNAPYGSDGQTVKDRLDEVGQRRTALTDFAHQLDGIYETISPADWISYHDRWMAFGEDNAIKWLLDKYGQK